MQQTATPPTRIEAPVRVRFDEAGPDGLVRTSTLLCYVQDVAWQHSEGAGFGRDWYGSRGLTWLVRSIELDVVTPVEYGEALLVSTEVVGFRRVWARRLSEIVRAAGRDPVATATIDWVLLNAVGMPVRVPGEIIGAFPVELPSFEPARVRLPEPNGVPFRHEFAVRQRDLDPLAHVNNSVYVDYLEEAVALAGGTDSLRSVPRAYRLEFILPAGADARLNGLAGRVASGWSFRLEDAGGRELFRSLLDA